jgi:hypothetical protein
MIRTQIQLTAEQVRRLRMVAHRDGVSMAEVIRCCIDSALPSQEDSLERRYERAAFVVGAFRDRTGAADVATAHDEYLDDAFSTDQA